MSSPTSGSRPDAWLAVHASPTETHMVLGKTHIDNARWKLAGITADEYKISCPTLAVLFFCVLKSSARAVKISQLAWEICHIFSEDGWSSYPSRLARNILYACAENSTGGRSRLPLSANTHNRSTSKAASSRFMTRTITSFVPLRELKSYRRRTGPSTLGNYDSSTLAVILQEGQVFADMRSSATFW